MRNQTQTHLVNLLDILATATTNFVRSFVTVALGMLFLFYTTIGALAVRTEYAQGDYTAVAGGLLIVTIALGATIFVCFTLAPTSQN